VIVDEYTVSLSAPWKVREDNDTQSVQSGTDVIYGVKLAFHGADTDTDFLADILAMIVARMSACR